jgi:hypothetical protein
VSPKNKIQSETMDFIFWGHSGTQYISPAKPAAGAHQRFRSPLPLPCSALGGISRHFIMGLILNSLPRNGVKKKKKKKAK